MTASYGWAACTDYVHARKSPSLKSTALIVEITGAAESIDAVRSIVEASYRAASPLNALELDIDQTEILPIPNPLREYTEVKLTTGVQGLVDAIRHEMNGQCITVRDPARSTWRTTALQVRVIEGQR